MNLDLQGWHSDRPIFKRLLETVKPKTVFELGSWKGASIINMVTLAKQLGLDTRFFAVDFWSPAVVIQDSHGTFEQFMFNIEAMGCADRITPVRMGTGEASRKFFAELTTADLIYVDAGHTYDECLLDMEHYWPLLNKGGVMFGDDVTEIPSVREAVEEFCRRHNLYYRADYYHWEMAPKQ